MFMKTLDSPLPCLLCPPACTNPAAGGESFILSSFILHPSSCWPTIVKPASHTAHFLYGHTLTHTDPILNPTWNTFKAIATRMWWIGFEIWPSKVTIIRKTGVFFSCKRISLNVLNYSRILYIRSAEYNCCNNWFFFSNFHFSSSGEYIIC